MRKRVDQLGVAQPEIQRTGADEIDVALPDVSNARRAEEQVGKTAQLYFYDWEPNVIGPNGKPAPSERDASPAARSRPRRGYGPARVPGGPARRQTPGDPAQERHHWTPGCTPAQVNGCIYGAWYLVDTKHEKVLCAATSRSAARPTRADLYADNYKPPPDAKVEGGARQPGHGARPGPPMETQPAKSPRPSPNSCYVLNDDPVLDGADINNPQQSFRTKAAAAPVSRTSRSASPARAQGLPAGHQGDRPARPGSAAAGRHQGQAALQHFAIVLDGQLITAPSIDYTEYPDGIDATNGSQIPGGFTLTSAQNLAQTSCSRARCRSSWS